MPKNNMHTHTHKLVHTLHMHTLMLTCVEAEFLWRTMREDKDGEHEHESTASTIEHGGAKARARAPTR